MPRFLKRKLFYVIISVLGYTLFLFLGSLLSGYFAYQKASATTTPNAICDTDIKIDDILEVAETSPVAGSMLDGSRYLYVYKYDSDEIAVFVSPDKSQNRQLHFTWENNARRNFGVAQTSTTYPAYNIRILVDAIDKTLTHNVTQTTTTGAVYVSQGDSPLCYYAISDDFPKEPFYGAQYNNSSTGTYSTWWRDNNDGDYHINFTERRALENPFDACANIAGNQPEVPEGMEADEEGNCISVSTGGGGGTSPEQLQALFAQFAGIALASWLSILVIRQFRFRGTE